MGLKIFEAERDGKPGKPLVFSSNSMEYQVFTRGTPGNQDARISRKLEFLPPGEIQFPRWKPGIQVNTRFSPGDYLEVWPWREAGNQAKTRANPGKTLVFPWDLPGKPAGLLHFGKM